MTLAKLGGNKSLKILLPRFQALYSVFEIVDFFKYVARKFCFRRRSYEATFKRDSPRLDQVSNLL